MRDYILSHAISITIPLVLLMYGALFWSGVQTTYWTFLLIITFTLGYVHYFVGFYYQIRSFFCKADTRKQIIVFLTLFLAAVIFSWFLISQSQIFWLSLFVIIFFNIHGFLNEKTLLKTQAGVVVSHTLFLPWALVTSGLLFMALPHVSLMYSNNLQYADTIMQAEELVLDATTSFQSLVFFGACIFLLGIVIICFTLFTTVWSKTIQNLTTGSIILAIILFIQSPLNYVYFFSFLLSYHFIQWSIAYLLLFRSSKPTELPVYITLHLIIILLCFTGSIVLYSSVVDYGPVHLVASALFDLQTFITFALVHLTTTLMNEDAIKKVLKLS